MKIVTDGGSSVTVTEVDGELVISLHPKQKWSLEVPMDAFRYMERIGGGGAGRSSTPMAGGAGGGGYRGVFR